MREPKNARVYWQNLTNIALQPGPNRNRQSILHSSVMKKSKAVPATLVISIAAIAIAGCGSNRQVRRCVDEQGNLLPDSACTTTTYRSGSTFIYPRWVYGGSTSGRRVTGYSTTPSSSADVVDSRGSVIRRGFSSSSHTSSSSFGS